MTTNTSSNFTSNPQFNQSTIPPALTAAIIEGFAAAIRPTIIYIMLHTVLASMLIPIVIALFFFSSSQSRRRPIFILNIMSLFAAFGLAAWGEYIEARLSKIVR